MTTSPYAGEPESSWLQLTQKLVSKHPLRPSVLLNAVLTAWGTLWQSTVGTGALAVKLSDLRVPATIIGYFFEVLLARELQRQDPKWRGNLAKDEKDLVFIPDPTQSIEIKASGQAGFKVYGNRSYGQRTSGDLAAKKEKSGFYVTVNFYGQTLTLIRFGWIDAEDWDAQEAPTGQMAGLKKKVYECKLIPIPGAYRLQTPVLLLDGVGEKTAAQFGSLDIHTVQDLLEYPKELPKGLGRVAEKNRSFLDGCKDAPAS